MGRLSRIVLLLLLVGLTGGVIALALWDIPAPSATVEKVIADDRFPR